MGGGSSQPSSTTSTVVQEAPEEVRAMMPGYLSRANALSSGPYQSFGNRVSPLDQYQVQGMDMAVGQANAANPVGANAVQEVGRTVGGEYLNANPYLDDMYNRAARAVTDQYQFATKPGLDAAAIRAGAFGDNSGYQQFDAMQRYNLGENLGNLATDIYGGNYQLERNRMLQGAQMFPSVYQGAVAPSQSVMGVGDVYRDYSQALLNQSYEDFEAKRLHNYRMLDVLGNAIGVAMGGGGSTVTTQPSYYRPNPTANALGAGLLGYGMGSQLFGGQ